MIQRGISNSATELETAALVWALTKLPQYFDDEPFTVIMDHSALKSAPQTRNTERRSARLNEWAMFLATYLPRMKIIHESGKAHLNADDLSRLACVENDDDKKQYQESESIISLSTKTDDTQTNFLNTVKEELSKDDIFGKIMNKIKKQIVQADFNNEEFNMTYHSYKLNPTVSYSISQKFDDIQTTKNFYLR
jgi:hypothetical protein